VSHFGVDVSSNNPHPIAWAALFTYLEGLGGDKPFAIVKISQGTGYVNPDASADIAAARAAGFVVGGYLMDQGNADPASEEALFRANAEGVPQFDDDELPEGLSTSAYIAHLQSLVAVADVPQYLNQSEEDEGFPAGEGLWEANYNNQPGVTHRAGVLIHQYTSSATVPDAAGQFDLNCWTGSEVEFEQFFGLTPPTSGGAMALSPSSTHNGQKHVAQATVGYLWHKYWTVGPQGQIENQGNETLAGPSGGSAGGCADFKVTVASTQPPGVTVNADGSIDVTFEGTDGGAWCVTQEAGSASWTGGRLS
jgi:hypothetical protein